MHATTTRNIAHDTSAIETRATRKRKRSQFERQDGDPDMHKDLDII